MSLCVLRIGIMDVVGSHQIDPGFLAHTQKLLVYQLLLGQTVILELQEKIPFAEDFLITKGGAFCLFIHTSYKISGYFSCKAGA